VRAAATVSASTFAASSASIFSRSARWTAAACHPRSVSLTRQAVYLHFPGREALLDALRAESPAAPDLDAAPSARAALGLLISARSNADPALAALTEPTGDGQARLAQCRTVAGRFKDEGALAPQLSVETGAA